MLKTKDGKGGRKANLILDSSSSDSESERETSVQEKKKNKGKGVSEEGLTINKNYAERYDNWRNKEEMQKLKDRLGVTDINDLKEDESSSESSEEEVEWTPEQEKAFFKTLASLKMKDPSIYSDEFGFFNKNAVEEEKPKEKKKKKQDKKPFTVRDHERKMILEKGGELSDEDEEDKPKIKKEPMSYNEELASIKNEFSKALNDIESSDEEEGTLLGSNLLKQKERSREDKEKEEEEQKRWLKGELDKLEDGKLPKDEEKQLLFLRKYWTDEKLDDGEKFLRDYILNRKYADPKEEEEDDYIPSYNEVVHDDDDLSNDEKFEAEREEFEHKYNFRFEEPDQEFIKRYPRTIEDSLRREDTKRKEQRQKTKERKEEIKSKTREEVQRLKALKRREIMDKIQKLHEITGNPDLELTEMDIDGDFDPEEYDKRMQQIFNDEYYQEGDEEKPEFPYDEEIDDEVNWEDWVPAREAKSKAAASESSEDSTVEDEQADESTEDDDEAAASSRSRKKSTQKELIEASKGKRGKRKKSAFLEALEREKPKFDPKIHKSFEQYFDEYYKLDFEDVVGGDLKCRFKYHKVTPNDFGLSTDEILKADDRELNKWASLKKTFQYRDKTEEDYEVQAYKRKSQQEHLKKRILLSVYHPNSTEAEGDEDQNQVEGSGEKKKRKKKKKKNKEQNPDASATSVDSSNLESPSPRKRHNEKNGETQGEASSPKKRKEGKNMKLKTSKTSSPAQSAPVPTGLSKRQRKNLKRKLGSAAPNGDISSNASAKNATGAQDAITPEKKEKRKDKKKHFKRKASESNDTNGAAVDEDRLRAYGLNPKKFKKRMKYGASTKA